METRPMSAGKRWVVLEIIGKKKEQIEDEDKGMPAPVRRAKETVPGQAKETVSDTK